MKNITELFVKAAAKHPDRIAIIDKNDSISYHQLEIEVRQTAQYFLNKGIQKGDRVLVFVPMGIDLYRIVLALFYIGATAVFLDEWVSRRRLEICCKIADCKGFVGVWKARVFSLFSKELRRIPIKLSLKKQDKRQAGMVALDLSSSALITFTTGSTGIPKAADRTHAFLKEQFEVLIDEIDPQVEDVDMPVLPIVLFVNLGIGCTSVIADFKMTKPNLLDPAVIVNQLTDHRVTRITASPFFVKRIAEYGIEHNIDFLRLKKVFTGGAPVFPDEAQLYCDAFRQATSTIVYGSTEVEPISSIKANQLALGLVDIDEGLWVGQVYHKTTIRILKITKDNLTPLNVEEFDQLCLPEGEIGEIVVAGNHVLNQYFKNEEAFKANKIVVDGIIWHRTGDSGYTMSEDLYLTGRVKQLIELENGFISPFIIENQLQSKKGIDKGTMIKSENQKILIIESSLTEEQIKNLCKEISYDKLLKVGKIPMDPRHNSKIDYGSLVSNVL